MVMVLDNKRSINGVPPKIAREICRWCSHQFMSASDLAQQLEMTKPSITRWLCLLVEAEYLYMRTAGTEIQWGCTMRGYRDLATARQGKPLTGLEFSNLVLKVIERIKCYNSEPRHPFSIDEAYLFGPIILQPWLTDDPNIIISVRIKPEIKQNRSWRSDYARQYGPNKNQTFIDYISFADLELARALRKKGERIDVCVMEDPVLPVGSKLIYQRVFPDVEEGDRMQAAMSPREIAQLGQAVDRYRAKESEAMRKRRKAIRLREIVEYWKDDIHFLNLGIPIERAAKTCWRCGSSRDLQRCHIVPDSLGGPFEASNCVILCRRCHGEGPNLVDAEIMFDWISAYRSSYSGDYWKEVGAAEYRFLYGKSVHEEIGSLIRASRASMSLEDALYELDLLLNEFSTQAVFHFGQSWFSNATMAGLYKSALKELSERLNKANGDDIFNGLS